MRCAFCAGHELHGHFAVIQPFAQEGNPAYTGRHAVVPTGYGGVYRMCQMCPCDRHGVAASAVVEQLHGSIKSTQSNKLGRGVELTVPVLSVGQALALRWHCSFPRVGLADQLLRPRGRPPEPLLGSCD